MTSPEKAPTPSTERLTPLTSIVVAVASVTVPETVTGREATKDESAGVFRVRAGASASKMTVRTTTVWLFAGSVAVIAKTLVPALRDTESAKTPVESVVIGIPFTSTTAVV